jgi:hypothetical protein
MCAAIALHALTCIHGVKWKTFTLTFILTFREAVANFLRTKRNKDELTLFYARGIPSYDLMNIESNGKTVRTRMWRVEPPITANKPKRVISTVTGNFPS